MSASNTDENGMILNDAGAFGRELLNAAHAINVLDLCYWEITIRGPDGGMFRITAPGKQKGQIMWRTRQNGNEPQLIVTGKERSKVHEIAASLRPRCPWLQTDRERQIDAGQLTLEELTA